MRKILNIFFVVMLVTLVYSLVLAEEQKDSPMGKGMMQQGMMHKKGMMKMCSMYKMMKAEMIATKDGGVIVMVGNKLLKYDRNLNLKKEVEIKIDTEGMQNMMKEMMEKCPMHKTMMRKDRIRKEDAQ